MQQLNLQLYCKTKKTNFNELCSDRKTIMLTQIPMAVKLAVEVPKGDDILELRLDPDDKPSTFILHNLNVRAQDGTELYIWNGNPGDFNALVDVEVSKIKDEVIVQSFSTDPFLLIPLSKPQPNGVVVELSVSRPLLSLGGQDAAPEVALAPHQPELTEAIRVLQTTFRLALDDLAEEQEGLQDALVIHHAHARSESQAISEQISGVLGFAISLQDTTQKLGGEIARNAAALEQQTRKLEASFDRRLADLQTSSDRRAADLCSSLAQLVTKLDASFEKRLAGLETSSDRRSIELEALLGDRLAILQASLDNRTKKLEILVNRLEGLKALLQQLTSDVGAMESAFADTITKTARHTEAVILSEVRDDWRSTRQQITEATDRTTRQLCDRESEISTSIRATFAGITQAVHQLASSQDTMRQVRSALRVSEDADAIASLQQLHSSLEFAQQQLGVVESSLSWRLTRPFRALSQAVKGLHKP